MPLTTIPIGLEVLNLLFVWSSIFHNVPLGLWTKIILTVAFVVKFACYFFGALVIGIDNPKLRNVLLALCVLINAGIIAYSIISGVRMLLINNAVLLGLLVVWSFLSVFEISWVWGKKK